MKLTADQKEHIMAQRGQASAPSSRSGTRRYVLLFSCGKKCTALDMQSEPPESFIPGVMRMFQPGYVISVDLQDSDANETMAGLTS